MAYSSAVLTAKQISDYDKDYPILVGNNAFDFRHLSSGRWTVGDASDSTDSDVTNSSFPFYNVASRDAVSVSKTTGTSGYHYAHFDPVGTFVSEGCSFSDSSTSITPDDPSDLDSIRPGMYVADSGRQRYIGRGMRVVTVGGASPTFVVDRNPLLGALSIHGGEDLTLTGNPEADKAVIDSLFVFNHNLHTGSTANCHVQLYVRDFQEHAGVAVSGTTHTSGKPIIELVLAASGTVPYKFSALEAASLRVTSTGSTPTGYSAGCVWAGERWQLPRWPDKPYDDKGTHSGASDHTGESGFLTRQSTWAGRAFRQWSIPLSADADVAGCQLFQRGCDYFTRPFVLVENPKTDPKAYIMQAESAAVVFPKTGKHERVFNITMVEKPPFYSTY